MAPSALLCVHQPTSAAQNRGLPTRQRQLTWLYFCLLGEDSTMVYALRSKTVLMSTIHLRASVIAGRLAAQGVGCRRFWHMGGSVGGSNSSWQHRQNHETAGVQGMARSAGPSVGCCNDDPAPEAVRHSAAGTYKVMGWDRPRAPPHPHILRAILATWLASGAPAQTHACCPEGRRLPLRRGSAALASAAISISSSMHSSVTKASRCWIRPRLAKGKGGGGGSWQRTWLNAFVSTPAGRPTWPSSPQSANASAGT